MPVTRDAYQRLRRESHINHLRKGCKAYSDLLNEEEISESSGHCVICLDEYAEDTPVMRLKCGHHFHTDCVLKWLDEKEQCPICLQDFQKATNHHVSKELLIESVDFEADNNVDIEADIDEEKSGEFLDLERQQDAVEIRDGGEEEEKSDDTA